MLATSIITLKTDVSIGLSEKVMLPTVVLNLNRFFNMQPFRSFYAAGFLSFISFHFLPAKYTFYSFK